MRSNQFSMLGVLVTMLAAMATGPVTAKGFGAWAPAQSIESAPLRAVLAA
jgi:hypothetical protein